MTEALLTGEPQTPTDGTTAAQVPATSTSSVPMEQGKQTTPEVKTSEQAPEKKGLLTTEPKAAVPEKYEFKLDGDAKLSEPMQKGVEGAFREAGLTNEAANKLLNSLVKSHQESQEAAVASMRETWANEVKTDKELGGDNLNETLKYAKSALKEFGSKELTDLLDASGLSDNKHFIRLLSQIGRKVGGDSIVTGAKVAPAVDPLRKLYNNSNLS